MCIRDRCNGEGKIIKNKCKACAGEGIVYGEEVVEVKIPAGVAEGCLLYTSATGTSALPQSSILTAVPLAVTISILPLSPTVS